MVDDASLIHSTAGVCRGPVDDGTAPNPNRTLNLFFYSILSQFWRFYSAP